MDPNLLIFIALLTLIALQWLILEILERKWRRFKLIAAGIYEQSLDKKANLQVINGGAKTNQSGFYQTVFMQIFFKDGTQVIARDIDLPAPGTYIELYKNGFAEFKVKTPSLSEENPS